MWKAKVDRQRRWYKNTSKHILALLRKPPAYCSYFEIMQVAADVITRLQKKVKRLEARDKQRES
jgi:hypothetical protein